MATTRVEGAGSYAGSDGRAQIHVETPDETRRAFKTSEFFVLLASVAAVIVAGYASDDSLDVARIWTLVTVLASAYMISRGIAKAGSHSWHGHDIEARR